MKATGIVRRIDDLGRVVIPKEVRKTLRIREGDPLEIFTDKEGEVILKKYSPISELNEFAAEYADAVFSTLGATTIITDTDQVIAIAGGSKKDFIEKNVSRDLEKVMQGRTKVVHADKSRGIISITEEASSLPVESQVIVPIISQGDVIGSVIVVSKDAAKLLGDTEIAIAEIGASFLAKQMET
jgi:AbrB family transcriptional regulator (stage V sporulation protein T)